jgi:uncharacterized protein YggU (UPF0235/DUF167 family)
MLIKLKVYPDSKENSIVKKADDSYEIWVKSPAERGLANTAALQSLAKALNQNTRRLRIIKGATLPNKIVKILS